MATGVSKTNPSKSGGPSSDSVDSHAGASEVGGQAGSEATGSGATGSEAPKRHTYKAKRARGEGSLSDLKKKIWRAIVVAEQIVLEDEDPSERIKGIRALNGATASYLKVIEFDEMATSLEEARRQLDAQGRATGMR